MQNRLTTPRYQRLSLGQNGVSSKQSARVYANLLRDPKILAR